LAAFASGFTVRLREQGYSRRALSAHRGLVADLSKWLAGERLEVAALTPEVAEQFLRARCKAGAASKSSRSLQPLFSYLRELGELPAPAAARTPVEELLDLFQRYQLEERGLAAGTVSNHARVARLFLDTCPDPVNRSLTRLVASDITGFVLTQCGKGRTAYPPTVVHGLRALLRFLYVDGRISRDLASAVPAVATPPRALPRALDAGQLEQLLGSCDRGTAIGIRDFAILTVLARLGLRAGELTRLQLNDLDWRAGDVLIRGKGFRLERLPLPCDVGEAVADYLRRSRPLCSHPQLFIRSQAPLVGLSRGGVSWVVRAAAVRADVPPLGPHGLRHTVATGLLREGASLREIAQLLRHKSVRSTSIYATVDSVALSTLALPWAGGEA
jgi:site-specific recombinase XerD